MVYDAKAAEDAHDRLTSRAAAPRKYRSFADDVANG